MRPNWKLSGWLRLHEWGISSGLTRTQAFDAVRAAPMPEQRHESDERVMRIGSLTVALLAVPLVAAAEDLPLNPAVTQETIDQTVCVPGWTKTVRPPTSYTARIKMKLIRELELDAALLVDFELDHRIPLALGGAPSDPRNLELQPWDEAGGLS